MRQYSSHARRLGEWFRSSTQMMKVRFDTAPSPPEIVSQSVV
jgi:Uma2 family endonuclease